MQALDRLTALSQFLLDRQFAEGRVRLVRVSAYQHAAIAEQTSGRKPDRAASDGHKLQAAVDVVVLLPETPALPRDFVGARIGALVDHSLVWRTEIIRGGPEKRQRH